MRVQAGGILGNPRTWVKNETTVGPMARRSPAPRSDLLPELLPLNPAAFFETVRYWTVVPPRVRG